ncbi:MAG: antitoxin VapB family protein [Candidatus Aenigmatarchaeota archaeon]
MSTKTISISKEAYDRLKSLKSKKESFTDVINRMAGKVKLSDFAGILTEKEATELESSIKKIRSSSKLRTKRVKEELA